MCFDALNYMNRNDLSNCFLFQLQASLVPRNFLEKECLLLQKWYLLLYKIQLASKKNQVSIAVLTTTHGIKPAQWHEPVYFFTLTLLHHFGE